LSRSVLDLQITRKDHFFLARFFLVRKLGISIEVSRSPIGRIHGQSALISSINRYRIDVDPPKRLVERTGGLDKGILVLMADTILQQFLGFFEDTLHVGGLSHYQIGEVLVQHAADGRAVALGKLVRPVYVESELLVQPNRFVFYEVQVLGDQLVQREVVNIVFSFKRPYLRSRRMRFFYINKSYCRGLAFAIS
jgi:hypothetical protein